MKVIVTQRVAMDSRLGERRDCLDQRWADFLSACGLLGLPMSNRQGAARTMLDSVAVSGIVLTGGNDLAAYGGDAPERDIAEDELLDLAEERGLPVIAVCRGMQLVQHRRRVPLHRVDGHVEAHQIISIEGHDAEVNSYHGFGTRENRAPLKVWAVASDGLVKAVRDPSRRTIGLMWHPERLVPFAKRDIDLFRNHFSEQP